jgi:4-amino-4-deoxy-L-arabinose transferase-like glycosyltransferase
MAFVFIASTRVQVTSGRLGAGFILWISYTAVTGRILSGLGQLDQTALWLGIELLPVVVVVAFLRTDFLKACNSAPQMLLGVVVAIRSMVKTLWVLPILFAVVISYYAIGLYANMSLPQTMDDSLTAYLARAGFWVSSGSINFFETSSYNFPLVSYPALPTLSTVRWIVLTGTDHTAALDQWLATLISSSLVYAISKRVRLSSVVAMLVAVLWLLMPVTLLQSQMVLNDMIAMVAILTAILLSSHLFEEFRYSDCAVAFLGGLVAVGTKQTVLFMVPSAFLALALALWIFREKRIWNHFLEKQKVLYGSGLTLLGLFMSFPEYLFNQRRFGHPLGPSESFGYFADTSAGFEARVDAIGENARRVMLLGGLEDVPKTVAAKLPNLYSKVQQYYPQAGTELNRAVGVGWFGFSVTFLALVGLSSSLIVAWKRGKLFSYFLLTGGAILYAVLFMYTRPNFSEAFARYMLFPVTLLLIAGGFTIDAFLSLSKARLAKSAGQAAVVVLVCLAATQGAWSFFGNGIRPLVGARSAWNISDDEIFMLSNGFEDRGVVMPMLQQINQCLSDEDALGLAIPHKFPLSMLFGTSYKRSVTMLNPTAGTSIDAKFLESGDYAGIILHDDVKNSIAYDATGLWDKSYGRYTLLRVPTVKQNCG